MVSMLRSVVRAVSIVTAVVLAVVLSMQAGNAAQPEVVGALAGSWGGSGRITYTDGSSEGISCSAFYSGAGNELRMAIQCRSDKNPIHIRSKLRIDGKRATGDWEERTFNASGSASGTADGSSLSLNVSGGGFSGTMSVSFSKSSHSVTISTKGIAMSRATMQMSRR